MRSVGSYSSTCPCPRAWLCRPPQTEGAWRPACQQPDRRPCNFAAWHFQSSAGALARPRQFASTLMRILLSMSWLRPSHPTTTKANVGRDVRTKVLLLQCLAGDITQTSAWMPRGARANRRGSKICDGDDAAGICMSARRQRSQQVSQRPKLPIPGPRQLREQDVALQPAAHKPQCIGSPGPQERQAACHVSSSWRLLRSHWPCPRLQQVKGVHSALASQRQEEAGPVWAPPAGRALWRRSWCQAGSSTFKPAPPPARHGDPGHTSLHARVRTTPPPPRKHAPQAAQARTQLR